MVLEGVNTMGSVDPQRLIIDYSGTGLTLDWGTKEQTAPSGVSLSLYSRRFVSRVLFCHMISKMLRYLAILVEEIRISDNDSIR